MPEKTEHNRLLCDRRNGLDRRKESGPCKTERRVSAERRQDLIERRTGWIRDTQWSSVFIEVLK